MRLERKRTNLDFVSHAIDLLAWNSFYKEALTLLKKYSTHFPPEKLNQWVDWNEENLNRSIKEGELQSTSVFYGQSGQITTLPLHFLRIDKEGVVITEKSRFLDRLKKTTFLWKDKPNIIVETWQPPTSAGGRSFYAAYKGVKISQGHKRFTLDLTPADSPLYLS